MGRDKSHRVKGNVKPASSGRTAELVSSQAVTFESLSGGAGVAATFVPIIPDPEETGLDPQLSLTLRKLGKKDSTTKTKALTELLDLCNEDANLPLVILPYWPRIYARLAVDEFRKVRELCHNLLSVIASSVGRQLGPHMKSLFPTWFLAQNDSFPPAASAATNAFKAIFPTEEKQLQAIKFCCPEIVSLVVERLDGKEELDKYTGLTGLSKIVQLGVGEEIGTIFKHDKFWALAENESGLVRRSFFDLLSSLAEKCPEEIPKSKLTRTITTALEKEKFELQSLWNCFLTLTLKGVFQQNEVAKTQLLLCCQKGFYGNASQLGPLVLPLVHKIGSSGDGSLFLSLEEGFRAERSNSERQAILRTYAEVLSYEHKQSETVPPSVFAFITSELKRSIEFGRIVYRLIKNEVFYTQLSDFCIQNEEIMKRPEFGHFLLSFVDGGKKSVQFEASESSCNYEDLEQKLFIKTLSLKLISSKNYKSFSTVSRFFSSSVFYSDLMDASEIPNLFQCSEENKLYVLRIGLDLVKAFPASPASLTLVSASFEFFLDDLGTFIREIDRFDLLKPLRNWLRSDVFTAVKSKHSLKYILKKGSTIFKPETIQAKLQEVVQDFDNNLDTITSLLLEPSGSDLTEVIFAVWDHYVKTPANEQLEILAWRILEQGLIPKQVVFNKLSSRVQFCDCLAEIKTLVELTLKIEGFDFEISSLSCEIDPDLLVFRGFKFPKLRNSSLLPPAEFKVDRILKISIYEGQLGLEKEEADLSSFGLNLLYAKTLTVIHEDLESTNWNKRSLKELGDEVAVLLTRVLEKLATDPQQWKEFSSKVFEMTGDSVWSSKFPVEEFLHTIHKMELPNLFVPIAPTDLSDVESIFKSYLNVPDLPSQFLIDMLTKERNDHPERFHFETLFSHVEEKQELICLLELTMELMSREESFLSTAACWISAWLRNSKNIIMDSKLSLLWTTKLSRSVVLLHQLAKTNLTFTQEYVEFHTANLFPSVYAHFVQLQDTSQTDVWRLITVQNVAEAVSLVPTLTLQAIEQEPIKVFERFTPALRRPEIFFKVAAYKLMKKVTVKDEIIPKELNRFFQQLKDNTEYPDEFVVTYLLAWDALLYCQSNANELAQYVKDDKLLPRLLSLLFFTLIPDHPKQFFETDPELSTSSIPDLEHLSCSVLQHVLRSLPYTVRSWWSSLTKQRDKVFVEKIITKHLSAKLAAEELGKVKWNEKDDNVTVHCHPGCNELIARYKIEDTSVTLTITLPLDHPLGPVSVQVSDKKLHARITQLLNTRSHSLSAGLELWKENLDGMYKDVEECAICFFVVNSTTKQLPKMGCKTCRKKFHSACLYKWFSTSNKSECPLCRNLF